MAYKKVKRVHQRQTRTHTHINTHTHTYHTHTHIQAHLSEVLHAHAEVLFIVLGHISHHKDQFVPPAVLG